MCGIFGWINPYNERTDLNLYDITSKGLIATQIRGTDATGFYTINHGIIKKAIKAEDFIAKKMLPKDIDECNFFLGHCRAASSKDSDKTCNAHPFESKTWILLHNGTLNIDNIDDYNYTSNGVDSEVLLSHIEKYGITKGIKKIDGSAALVLYNKKTNKIYFWTDSMRPLVLALFNDLIFFASTKSILKKALKIKNDFKIFPQISYASIYEHELLEFDVNKVEFTRKDLIIPKPNKILDNNLFLNTLEMPKMIEHKKSLYVPTVFKNDKPVYNSITQRSQLQRGCWVTNPKG
jgi:glucosamine 6-phosphate synthetase-like amidotransferase/phosphosugar isomerase protein